MPTLEKRHFGRTGMQVSVLGFGGAEIGYQAAAPETVRRLLNAALDAGLNVIDTAECYHDSETLIGQAVSHRRKDFYLFTKCGHDGKSFGLPDWDPAMLERSIERSLQRLGTDYVDLLQLHSCSAELLQRGEVIAVVQRAKTAGKTRFIGYSGDSRDALAAVRTGVFDSLQTSVNLADQEAIDLTIPEAATRHMGVIAKRPIANAAWINKGTFMGGYNKAYWERLEQLQYDFLSGPEASALALRFTLSVPGVSTVIVGTKNPARYAQNAQTAAAGLLPTVEYEAIRTRWKQVATPEWVGQV